MPFLHEMNRRELEAELVHSKTRLMNARIELVDVGSDRSLREELQQEISALELFISGIQGLIDGKREEVASRY